MFEKGDFREFELTLKERYPDCDTFYVSSQAAVAGVSLSTWKRKIRGGEVPWVHIERDRITGRIEIATAHSTSLTAWKDAQALSRSERAKTNNLDGFLRWTTDPS